MAIEIKRSRAVVISTTLIALAILGLVVHHDITWPQALAALGLLLAPSIAKAKRPDDAKERRDDDPPPPPPPSPPPYGSSSVPPMSLPVLLVLALVGCGSTSANRATARGAVLATAEAVKVADVTCAKQATDRLDVALARRCEAAYTDARSSLLVAATSIDAWDEGKRRSVVCATVHAAESLAAIVAEFRSRAIPVPPLFDDALRLVSAMGGCS